MNKSLTGLSAEKINELAMRAIAENEKKRGDNPPPKAIPLNFSVEIHELLTTAESDQTAAAKLLKMAAEQLRRGALHPMLVNYLADAFEAAMAKPPEYQARELTNELHLTSPNRRPAGSWLMIGNAFYDLVEGGMSQTKAKVEISIEFEIDEVTALKYYKQYVDAKEIHDNIE